MPCFCDLSNQTFVVKSYEMKECQWKHLKLLFCLTSSSETASSSEQQRFLGFASFVSELGPHPFLPALLGVVSVQSPLVMVMEELQHRDLLGYLWRCRQVQSFQRQADITNCRVCAHFGRQYLRPFNIICNWIILFQAGRWGWKNIYSCMVCISCWSKQQVCAAL